MKYFIVRDLYWFYKDNEGTVLVLGALFLFPLIIGVAKCLGSE
jgi:hypothetical protein